jgi:NAD(P) transhydrogenase subunit alpha
MSYDILTLVTIFVLSAFVGFEVISKVPSILHTPLMSGTNAIHGVVLVGSMIVLGQASGAVETTLGFVAVVLATVNVVGGFVVTDRMLEMFKGRQPGKPVQSGKPGQPVQPGNPGQLVQPDKPDAGGSA